MQQVTPSPVPAPPAAPDTDVMIRLDHVTMRFDDKVVLDDLNLDVPRGKVTVVLGGSGNGEAMVANRVKGIRCALCWNAESARLCRQHNNANVLSLGQRMMTLETALELVRIWLETPFEGGRHQRRIDLIDKGPK